MANKTVMQKHLEWLKGRMVVSPQIESQLLEKEKQQIIDAWYDGIHNWDKVKSAQDYYKETYGGQNNE